MTDAKRVVGMIKELRALKIVCEQYLHNDYALLVERAINELAEAKQPADNAESANARLAELYKDRKFPYMDECINPTPEGMKRMGESILKFLDSERPLIKPERKGMTPTKEMKEAGLQAYINWYDSANWEETELVDVVYTAMHKLEPPIDMLLLCPRCQAQHVDKPNALMNWTNPPHKSHLCAKCGLIWRPCDSPTNGVEAITTKGKDDTWTPKTK